MLIKTVQDWLPVCGLRSNMPCAAEHAGSSCPSHVWSPDDMDDSEALGTSKAQWRFTFTLTANTIYIQTSGPTPGNMDPW